MGVVETGGVGAHPSWVYQDTGELVADAGLGAFPGRRQLEESDIRRRVAAVLGATRLDTSLNKSHVLRGVLRAERARFLAENYVIRRRSLFGDWRSLPLKLVTRSWFVPEGRRRNQAMLAARAYRLIDLAKRSHEVVKLVTLTFASAGASWQAMGAVQRFLNAARTWATRQGATLHYLWTAETQKRLALHYHVVFVGLPFVPKAKLREWWAHGFVDVRAAKDSAEALAYTLKYVSKCAGGEQLDQTVRHVLHSAAQLRRHGASREVSATVKDDVPAWLSDFAEATDTKVAELDWSVDDVSQMAYIVLPDGSSFVLYVGELRWRLIAGWSPDGGAAVVMGDGEVAGEADGVFRD